MKIYWLIIVALFLSALSTAAQTAPSTTVKSVSPEAEKASVETVKLFKLQKYDEALQFAQKAVEINERELGATNIKTAQAYVNLGYVQRGRNDNKAAADAFAAAVRIFEKNENLAQSDSLTLAKTLESLGYLKFDAGKEGGAEKYYQRALELRQKFNGAEAAETATTMWSLANLERSMKNYQQAADLYRNVYQIRLKKSGVTSSETSDAMQRCSCTLRKMNKDDEADALEQQFDLAKVGKILTSGDEPYKGGVVNGKAINLQQPPYPADARKVRADGKIAVEVLIDEKGHVIHACGAKNKKVYLSLIEVSEWAAYKSPFTPTTVGGKPVKVTGTIIYNFIAQ